jgi:hypothetical protein
MRWEILLRSLNCDLRAYLLVFLEMFIVIYFIARLVLNTMVETAVNLHLRGARLMKLVVQSIGSDILVVVD